MVDLWSHGVPNAFSASPRALVTRAHGDRCDEPRVSGVNSTGGRAAASTWGSVRLLLGIGNFLTSMWFFLNFVFVRRNGPQSFPWEQPIYKENTGLPWRSCLECCWF